MKITSVNNDLVKETAKLLRGKYRDELGLFLIEGEKGVKEALEAGVIIERIFTLEGVKGYPEDKVIETTEAVLGKISDAKTYPKVIAVAKQLKSNNDNFKNFNKVLLLEDIKDAGNLGTILRTVSAFGIDGVVLFGDTVDLYNPKTVRSAVGCLWKVPVIQIKDYNILEDMFCQHERIATLPKGLNVVNLNDYIPAKKTLVMFGSEANGLSDKLKKFATTNLTIEMAPNVESLNLSISVAIVAYKLR